MNKLLLVFLLCIIGFGMDLIADDDVVGFWKTVNDKTGKAESVVAVYEYQGKYYGRLVAAFNKEGVIDDTIYEPRDRAPGVEGNPYYSGMDIIWDLKKKGSKYADGKVIDPEKGRVYDAEMWIKDGNLIMRGELLFFGENETWPPMKDEEFPKNFKKPDVSTFVPVIPQVKHH